LKLGICWDLFASFQPVLILICLSFRLSRFFDFHVMKLFRIKDIATFQALDVFCVFVPGDNSNPWVFAGGNHCFSRFGILVLFPQIVASFQAISNGFFGESLRS
jgi:hypothetical protein